MKGFALLTDVSFLLSQYILKQKSEHNYQQWQHDHLLSSFKRGSLRFVLSPRLQHQILQGGLHASGLSLRHISQMFSVLEIVRSLEAESTVKLLFIHFLVDSDNTMSHCVSESKKSYLKTDSGGFLEKLGETFEFCEEMWWTPLLGIYLVF